MRILIIDDEQIVLDSVSHILKMHFDELEVFTARNGKEGLVMLENIRPHIVMTDIRMPGITGIEFIRRARRFDTRVKIIIATAFDQFDYAKEAFKFQIEDYVLKPLTKVKLIDLVSAVIDKIKREQGRRDIELESIDKLYKALSIVENNFFYTIIGNRSEHKALSHYRELLGLPFKSGRIIGFEAVGLPDDVGWKQISDYNNRLFDAAELFKSRIKLDFNATTSDVFVNKMFAYVESDDEEQTEQLKSLLLDLHDELIKVWALKVKAAIGPVVDIEVINDSYEAVETLLKHSQQNVVVYRKREPGSYGFEDLVSFADEVFSKVSSLDEKWQQSWQLLEAAYNGLLEQAEFVQIAIDTISYLYMKAVVSYEEQGGDVLQLLSSGDIHQFTSADTAKKLTETHRMLNILSSLLSRSERTYSELVTSVMQSLKHRYMEDLSLEGLANEEHVTPQHLSRVFRQDTGTTFKTCLTDMRLTSAKGLMLSTDYSIKEIAYRVGYNDPNYFVRLFKKVTGFTPGEYQKVMSK